MAAIETIPPCIVRHRVDPFMLRYAACSHNPRLRNLCGGRLLNRLDIGPTTALELDVQDVRFGSKADICSAKRHVRFTPKSGHVRCNEECPLSAKSGHCMMVQRRGDQLTSAAKLCDVRRGRIWIFLERFQVLLDDFERRSRYPAKHSPHDEILVWVHLDVVHLRVARHRSTG